MTSRLIVLEELEVFPSNYFMFKPYLFLKD